MTEKLFVYGTLCPGCSNAHILQGIGGDFFPATTRGRLLPKGWGAAQGYPGLLPDAQGEVVQGFLFVSAALSDAWAMLDDFEGEGYQRCRIAVTLADGTTDEAWVYALRPLSS